MTATAAPMLQAMDPADLAEDIEPVADHAEQLMYARQAKEIVGHSVLFDEIRMRTLPNRELTLLSVLREHGIRVYRHEDVEDYKEFKRTEPTARLEQWAEWCFAAFLTAISLLLCAIPPVVLWLPGQILFGPGAVMIGTFIAIIALGSQIDRIDAKWINYRIDAYPNQIPRAVLDLAMKIKQKVPKATFSVQEFTMEKRPFDPLLFVELDEAWFCIAVWDEPDFNASLVE